MNDPQHDRRTPNTPTPPPRSVLNNDPYRAAPPPAPVDDDLYDNRYVPPPPRKYDDAESANKKWIDFAIGFGGIYLMNAVIGTMLSFAGDTFAGILLIIAHVAVIVYSIMRRRYFIIIGMVTAYTISLIAFGACALILNKIIK